MFFSVNSPQELNEMIAYDLYRSFKYCFEKIKENNGTLEDVMRMCKSVIPIDEAHPDTIDTPIPAIHECRGKVTITGKYGMIGIALTGYAKGEPDIKDFHLADAYHAYYIDDLSKQYYYHEMKQKYSGRDSYLESENKKSKLSDMIKTADHKINRNSNHYDKQIESIR